MDISGPRSCHAADRHFGLVFVAGMGAGATEEYSLYGFITAVR